MLLEETIVHDVVMILNEHGITNREYQESCIKGYMKSEFIKELEAMLKKYHVWYDCDFKELQKKIIEDVQKSIFRIVD